MAKGRIGGHGVELAAIPEPAVAKPEFDEIHVVEAEPMLDRDTDSDPKMEVPLVSDAVSPVDASPWHKLGHESLKLVALGGPMALQYLFSYGSSVISLAFVGHLGTYEMSSAVLGTSFSNVTGFALLTGLSSALETLCGQAYGAGEYATVGISLQRGLLVLGTFYCCMLPVWLNFEPLMTLMGQQPDLAAGAARYMRLLLPNIFFGAAFQCLNRYLASQSIVRPQTVAAAGTTLFAPISNYILIYKLGLGLDGAAIATGSVAFVQFLILLGFVVHHNRRLAGTPEQTWPGWTLQAFRGWWTYLCLAAPSAAMIIVEWSTFEMMILMSGLLPHPEVATATMGWLFNVSTLAYLIPLGLSGAGSTRVSNALGGQRPDAARTAALAVMVLATANSTSMAAIIIAARHHLGSVFSSDPKTVALGASVLPVLGAALLGDSINGALAGVVRGAGRQTVGAATNLFSYWVIGMPASVLLAFHLRLGVHGLWGGLLVATSVQAIVLGCIVFRFDWDKEARKAAARVETARASGGEDQHDELLQP